MVNRDDFEKTALPAMIVLRKYALHLTMNSENAKDLLQDTYLKAYRFWGHFNKGTNINAWLFRIMKNAYINRYRRERNKPTHIRYEEYHLPHNGTQETSLSSKHLEEKSYDEVFGDEIIRSIESIHETFRNVIVLGDVEGLSYEEIASTVDCPIGTVRSRLHRGRKILKERLFAYAKDNGYISKSYRM
jgi:RNA polymerase sigma-70 factor (ECF subfamily)